MPPDNPRRYPQRVDGRDGRAGADERTERGSTPAHVHPQVLQRFEAMRVATGEGSHLVSDLQQGVMEVTDVVASGAAELVQQATATATATPPPPRGSKAPDPKLHAVKTVVLAGAEAFEEIFSSVVEATTTTARGTTNATVDIVQHKFGDKAAQATADGLHSVGNVAQAAFSFITMGPKTVARRMATSSIKHSCRSSAAPAAPAAKDSRFAWMFEDLNAVTAPSASVTPAGAHTAAASLDEHDAFEAAHDTSAVILQMPPAVTPL